MSMIDRYRKPGGFVQLLKLLETCGPVKQEKFLEIIRAEDPFWADAIQRKILTFERIFTWSDDTLNEIVGTLQDLTVAIVLHGSSPERSERIKVTFTHARRRRVEDLFGTNRPSPPEITAMNMKVVETVRQLTVDGYLRLDKLDVELFIQEGIEDRLANAAPHETERSGAAAERPAGQPPSTPDSAGASPPAELLHLRKRVVDLGGENASLRHEVTVLRSKLEQIKKIA